MTTIPSATLHQLIELLTTLKTTIEAKNKVDKNGKTELFYAKTAEEVKLLLEKGIDINHQDLNGNTALMAASKYSNTSSTQETVEVLIKAGANLDIQNKYGYTALILASMCSNTSSKQETVEALVKAGAKLDIQTNDDYTALIIASIYSNTSSTQKTVEALVKAGATLGYTALMLASKQETIDYLTKETEKLKPKKTIKFLEENGIEIS